MHPPSTAANRPAVHRLAMRHLDAHEVSRPDGIEWRIPSTRHNP